MKRHGRPRPYLAPGRSKRLYVGLPGRDVGLLRFLLAAVVRLSFAPDRRAEVEAFLAAAAVEIPGLSARFDPEPGGGRETAKTPTVTAW